jgi:hypothetical protein
MIVKYTKIGETVARLNAKVATLEAALAEARKDADYWEAENGRMLELCRTKLGKRDVHGVADGIEQLAEALEDAARLKKAREILFAYTDNEITADPWWAVVRNGSFGRMVVLDGPFFSRERAEALRNARLYEYGAKSYVYCFSGHRSQHYKELRAAIGAPDRAAIDAARKP